MIAHVERVVGDVRAGASHRGKIGADLALGGEALVCSLDLSGVRLLTALPDVLHQGGFELLGIGQAGRVRCLVLRRKG